MLRSLRRFSNVAKSRSALGGGLAGIVGGVPSKATDRTKATAKIEATPKTPKTGSARSEGTGKMQTIYLKDADLERVFEVEHALKTSREVPGRIGLSLLLRIGLDLLADELRADREAVLVRAKRIAEGE